MWILISIFIATDPYGSHALTTEFDNKKACVAAMNDIEEFYRWQYAKDGKYNAYRKVVCYSKETGEKVIQ